MNGSFDCHFRNVFQQLKCLGTKLLEVGYSGVVFFSLSYQPQLAVTSVRILRVMDVILITLVLPPQYLAIVT